MSKKSRIIYDSSRGNGNFDDGFPPIEKVNFVYATEEVQQPNSQRRSGPTPNFRNPERGAKFKQATLQTTPPPQTVPSKPAIKQVQSTGDFDPERRKSKKSS